MSAIDSISGVDLGGITGRQASTGALNLVKETARDRLLIALVNAQIGDNEYLEFRNQVDEASTPHEVHEALRHLLLRSKRKRNHTLENPVMVDLLNGDANDQDLRAAVEGM